ncbi:MAG TPA: 6-phosphogluconolactonase [Woeseiaceae bacterium]|nr:6-phosphogluconolactonase [Woeseiaceae bacterium]
MDWRISGDSAGAEQAAAAFIAECLRQAVKERGLATFAVSGGRSPWGMFERLADESVEWDRVHVLQVDERVVPLDDDARNWSHFLEGSLAERIPKQNRHPMPVEEDAELAVGRYSATLIQWAGVPPQLDVVHLGIGEDGHTASLFADDVLLQDRRHWVGVSRVYEGHRRLTLTLPVLNSARVIAWFVIGAGRREVLERLRRGDESIAASHVQRGKAVVFTNVDLR